MHTEPKYEHVGRESSPGREYHIDSYVLTYPDGTQTNLDRQVPKRLGKTAKDQGKRERKKV